MIRVLSIKEEEVTKSLQYVYDAVTETIKRLEGRVPLIGFAGAPWTLMCYMVDGSGEDKKKEKFALAIHWLYENPEQSHALLANLAKHVSNHLINQIRYGCHLVQLFDSWAGLLSPSVYREFGLPYIKQIAETVKKEFPDVPIICFAKGANAVLEDLSNLCFDVISIDWTVDPSSAREIVKDKVALQGNLDPLILRCSKETIKKRTEEMLKSFGNVGKGYIANLGHGCLPDFDPDNVGAYIEYVHSISKDLISKNSI